MRNRLAMGGGLRSGSLQAIALTAACAAGVGVSLMPVAVAGLIAALVVAAVVAAPHLGLMALGVLTPVASASGGDLLVIGAVIGLVAASLAGTLLHFRLPRSIGTPVTVTAFAAYLVLSWLASRALVGPSIDLRSFTLVGALIVLPFLLVWVVPRDSRHSALIVDLFAWGATAAAGFVTLLLITGLTSPLATVFPDELRLRHHDVAGAIFVLAVAAHLAALGDRLGFPAVLRYAALGLLMLGVGASLSRAAYVGLVAVLAVFVLRKRRSSMLAVGGAIIVVAVVVGMLSGDAVIEIVATRLAGTAVGGQLDVSSEVRLDLWASSLAMAADHPVFGVGFHRFSDELPWYWTGTVSNVWVADSAEGYGYSHNLAFTVLAQGGMVGLGLLVATAVALMRDAMRAGGRAGEGALLALVGTAAICSFGEPVLSPLVAIPFFLINAAARAAFEGRG